MWTNKLKKILFACFINVINASFSQNYTSRLFSTDNGLPDSYIFSSFQDKEGFLWLATTKGVVKFDGQIFTKYETKYSDGDFVYTGATESNGKIWFGTYNGKIYNYDKETETLVQFTDSIPGSINQIIISRNKKTTYFISKGSGIFVLTNNKLKKIAPPELYQINFAIEFKEDVLMLASPEGVYNLEVSTGTLQKIKGLDSDIGRLQKFGEKIILSVNGGELLEASLNDKLNEAILIQASYAQKAIGKEVNCFYLDEKNNILYAGTKDESFHLVNLTDRSVKSYVAEEYKTIINAILVDKDNNVWVSTAGKGLFRFFKQEYSTLSFENQPVYSITKDQKGSTYYATDNGIFVTDSFNTTIKKIQQIEGKNLGKVNAVFYDGEKLWIGTHINGLYVINPGTLQKSKIEFSETDNLSINAITGSTEKREVYVCTNQEGVFMYESGQLKNNFSSKNSRVHNNVYYALPSINDKTYYATHNSSFAYSKQNRTFDIDVSKQNLVSDFNTLATDKAGNFAIGTDGDGVYFLNDTTITPLNLNHELESKFCNNLVYDKEGNLWIGLRYSLYKYYPHEKVLKKVELEKDDTRMFNNNSFYADSNGQLFFGTNKNVVTFKNSSTKNSLPICYILKINVFDSTITKNKTHEFKNNKYDFSFEFSALGLLNSEEITFSYILVGRDNKWSAPSKLRNVEFSNLEEGQYTFKVKAYNSEGFAGSSEASFTFYIDKPFWKKIWFWALLFVLIVALVIFIVRIRTASLIKAKVKLEKTVDEKTKELREEKELVEAKNEIIIGQNKEITSSITYAKRIQEAILPDKTAYEQIKNDILIYYKPKDIVSGDFYWFAEKDDRFLIAACDCTGHGVPGAFMSMIGSTLLNKIVFDKNESSPEKIIYEMDKEISKSLQQENSEVNDGMEAGLCSIDIKKREILFSSAGRPLLLSRKNELGYQIEEYKGDRWPIGGHAEVKNKTYTLNTINANEGDMVYIYSDGIVDQFNHAKQRRVSSKQVRELLKQISPLTINEQYSRINEFLEKWQGENSQTDDILVLGLRL